MLDPTIHAPPITPYDDGFSTESEDLDGTEDLTNDSHASPRPVVASSFVRNVAFVKSQPIQERQQLPVKPSLKHAHQENKDNPPIAAHIVARTEEKPSAQAAADLNTARNDGDITKAEYCQGCNEYLTPLSDILEAMKKVISQYLGNEPLTLRKEALALRQCSCCRVTYPLVALTVASRIGECYPPRCYTCNRGANSTKKAASVGVKRAVDGAVKETNDAGKASSSSSSTVAVASSAEGTRQPLPATIKLEDGEDEDERERVEQVQCTRCHGELMTLATRLQMIEAAAQICKDKGPPPLRQCACCRITYPMLALTKNSRKLSRAVPICSSCCQAGGSQVYEMLAVSDTFIEAFKTENPTLAQQIQARMKAETLQEQARNEKNRAMNNARVLQNVKAQTHKMINAMRITVVQQAKAPPREMSGHNRPANYLVPKMARKSMSATRLLVRAPANGNAAASMPAEGTTGQRKKLS